MSGGKKTKAKNREKMGAPYLIYGIYRPLPLVERVLSSMVPNIGSLMTFHRANKIWAIVIQNVVSPSHP